MRSQGCWQPGNKRFQSQIGRLEYGHAPLSAEASCAHASARMAKSHIAAAIGDVDALTATLSAGGSIEEQDGKTAYICHQS